MGEEGLEKVSWQNSCSVYLLIGHTSTHGHLRPDPNAWLASPRVRILKQFVTPLGYSHGRRIDFVVSNRACLPTASA